MPLGIIKVLLYYIAQVNRKKNFDTIPQFSSFEYFELFSYKNTNFTD